MKRLLIGLVMSCLIAFSANANTDIDSFPNRPVTIVIPFAAGGALDLVARVVAEDLSRRLGQSVLVENKPGASGTIGARYVAAAAPDGYTLMFAVSTVMAVAPLTLKSANIEPTQVLQPVVEIARGPFLLLVASSVPANNLAELIKLAKNPSTPINYGSVGVGSTHQFLGALLNRNTGTELFHIPYKGSGQVYTGILSGQIQAMFDTMPGPMSYIEAKSLRPLAVTGEKRLKRLPDVPTFSEQGVAEMDIEFSYGIVVPRGTPDAIVEKLNKAITATLNQPTVRSRLSAQDVVPSPQSSEEYGRYLAQLVARWKKVVVDTGFKPMD